jgi:hypothetical protein
MSSAGLVQTNGSHRSFQPSMKVSIADEVLDGCEGATSDGLAGDDPEEDLGQVQPGARGRREMQRDRLFLPSHAVTLSCLWVA